MDDCEGIEDISMILTIRVLLSCVETVGSGGQIDCLDLVCESLEKLRMSIRKYYSKWGYRYASGINLSW